MRLIKRILLTAAVVIAAIFIVANIFGGLENIHYYLNGYSSSYSDSGYVWSMDDGNYVRLLERRMTDRASGHEVDEEYAPYAAAADYYYAAVLYKAYTGSGDSTEAAAWKQKMDAARVAMGPETGLADQIDAFLAGSH